MGDSDTSPPSVKRQKRQNAEDIPQVGEREVEGTAGLSTGASGKKAMQAGNENTIQDFLRQTANRRKRKLVSLEREISPPPMRRGGDASATPSGADTPIQPTPSTAFVDLTVSPSPPPPEPSTQVATSPNNHLPFRLTDIAALPTNGTVTLRSLLSPPSSDTPLTSLWSFNYMHTLSFLISHIPQSTLPTLSINIVHGYGSSDPRRAALDADRQTLPYPDNIRLIGAWMPEPFGTHHTKMLILFAGDKARVIVHTANMIQFDWGNMTQGVWDSGWLSSLPPSPTPISQSPIGAEFKSSLLAYLSAYGPSRTGPLTSALAPIDFSPVRAIFLGSVPGRHPLSTTPFGWPGLQRILQRIPISAPPATAPTPTLPSTVAIQVSSIATLPNTWFQSTFFKALQSHCKPTAASTSGSPAPQLKLIFPTTSEIRASLNGYASGSSIHMKTSSAAHRKQVASLKPHFCRWSSPQTTPSPPNVRLSARALAAPHIKTYIRYNPTPPGHEPSIAWALLTSANLSMQAWGGAPTSLGSSSRLSGGLHAQGPRDRQDDGSVVRICSYEAGVLVHPGLFGEVGKVDMRGIFDGDEGVAADWDEGENDAEGKRIKVGIRMPYDWPLTPYKGSDSPWSKQERHMQPDAWGEIWDGE
ncbi:tyrosyl-DNA phosphodiesterase-domain-containing protein [Kalaharituber pfeilii]|nr:tyrosyl-DNA phosphodiesterase-domain-containing protein [Kalaharituber pfeilii]